MLSSIVPRKSHVECDSVHTALVGLLQQTILHHQPSVSLVGKASGQHRHRLANQSAHQNFHEVVGILVEAGWLPTNLDPNELSGMLDVPHPEQTQLGWRTRIQLSRSSVAATMLRTFLVLRVLYLRIAGQSPTVRLVADLDSSDELDALYLLGDVFTERYPVRARWRTDDSSVTLTLEGDPLPSDEGVVWQRSLFRRTRDLSVLFSPLRESLELPFRPLVVPRVRTVADEKVRVRLPLLLQQRDNSLAWLSYLQKIDSKPSFDNIDPTFADEFGGHWSVSLHEQVGRSHEHSDELLHDTSYLVWRRPFEPDNFVSVGFRDLKEASPAHSESKPESTKVGRISISMEPLGGACEIGANGYYYRFGHRGLLIDAGLDANRNGWLGLPDLERIEQLDAMVLTHAHLDHMGALPVVLYAFPDLPIYCTRATRDILLPLLSDTAKIGQIRFRETGEAPLISYEMVHAIDMDRFCIVEPGETVSIPEIPGLEMTAHHAGHIMGSIAAEFRMSDWHLLHTGDFSTFSQHSLEAFDTSGMTATHVVMEGTYSGRSSFTREVRQQNLDHFVEALYQAIDEHRCVLIPSFSVGRAQEMVSLIVEALSKSPTTAEVPVYTVGMINRINGLSCTVSDFFKEGYVERVQQAESFKVDLNPRYTSESQRLDRYKEAFERVVEQGPAVIVSSHGMMAENTGSYSIALAILQQQPLVDRVFLCGYMDPRTPGSRLKRRFLYDETIPMGSSTFVARSAADEAIREFSITSHASYQELEELALQVPTQSVTLIHGDGFALHAFANHLRNEYSQQDKDIAVSVPDNGERVSLGTAQCPESWYPSFESQTTQLTQLRAGGSLSHRRTQTRISPLLRTGGFAWLIIPVGESSTDLCVEHDQDFDRIKYVEVYRNNVDTWEQSWYLYDSYDDEQSVVDTHPSRTVDSRVEAFHWDTLDDVEIYVEVADKFGHIQDVRFDFSVVAEVQPLRFSIEASQPVLLFRVGGSDTPVLERLLEVDERYRVRRDFHWYETHWDPVRRELRVELETTDVGRCDRLQVWLRWPSGYLQRGPYVGPIFFRPFLYLDDGSTKLSSSKLPLWETTVLKLEHDIRPGSFRWAGGSVWMEGKNELHLLPNRVGSYPLYCSYRDSHHALVQIPVGDLGVSEGIELSCASTGMEGQPFELTFVSTPILEVDQSFRVHLNGDEVAEHWANELPVTVSLEELPPGQNVLEVFADDPDGESSLIGFRDIEILEHPILLAEQSSFLATSDSNIPAMLAWTELSQDQKNQFQETLQEYGFEAVWNDSTIQVSAGNAHVGLHTFANPFSTLNPSIPLLVLPPSFLMEEGAHWCWASESESLPSNWFWPSLDERLVGSEQPLLSIKVHSGPPNVQSIPEAVRGEKVFLPEYGPFRVLLCCGEQVLHEHQIERLWPSLPVVPQRVIRKTPKPLKMKCSSLDTMLSSLERTFDSLDPVGHAMAIHRNATGEASFELLAGVATELQLLLVEQVKEAREKGRPVGLFYPGPRLSEFGESLLSELLQSELGQLAWFQASPFSGVFSSTPEEATERMRAGLSSMVPSIAEGFRGDSLLCPNCSSHAFVVPERHQAQVQCSSCGFQSSSSQLLLTRSDLFDHQADLLLAPFPALEPLWKGLDQCYGQQWANVSQLSFPIVTSDTELSWVAHQLVVLATRWGSAIPSLESQDQFVFDASGLLGWNHPQEKFALRCVLKTALEQKIVQEQRNNRKANWLEIFTSILEKSRQAKSVHPTMIVFDMNELWNESLRQPGSVMKPGLEGVYQWVDMLGV